MCYTCQKKAGIFFGSSEYSDWEKDLLDAQV